MKWKLINEDLIKGLRTYEQELTNSQCQTKVIHTDKSGRRWWGFVDFFKIPYMRIAFSQQISNLFKTGFNIEDIRHWIKEGKRLSKSNDADKYEKIYALFLEKEKLVESTVDPIKQHTALATIYAMYEDEAIDYFDYALCTKKMNDWALYPESVAFFLNWHTGGMQSYIKHLNELTEIVSTVARPPKG